MILMGKTVPKIYRGSIIFLPPTKRIVIMHSIINMCCMVSAMLCVIFEGNSKQMRRDI